MVERELKKYKCGYCGNEFYRMVGIFNYVSDQVKCKRCNNFLKTWD